MKLQTKMGLLIKGREFYHCAQCGRDMDRPQKHNCIPSRRNCGKGPWLVYAPDGLVYSLDKWNRRRVHDAKE